MATDDPNAEVENISEQSPTPTTVTTATTATKETANPPPPSAEDSAEDAAPVVAMSELIQAGVHFGHQTRRWNPKMKRFIHGDVGGIYIIDLKQTLSQIEAAYVFVRNMVADGGTLLFVGTKKQSQESTALHAKRCGMPYVNERWLGGMLTNIETIFKRVHKMQEYQRMQKSGEFDAMPKKEALSLRRELAKLERNLGGIGQMDTPPEAVFVLDTKTDHIAVSEANKLRIPLIAVVDTNCDPDVADYLIPGNDDSIRSGDLMCRVMADAVIAGKRFGRLEEVSHPVGDPEDVSAPPAPTAEEVSPPPAAAASEPVSSEEPEEPPVRLQGDTPASDPAPEASSEGVIPPTPTPRAPAVEEETAPSLVVEDASTEETAVGGESQPQKAPAVTEEAGEAVGETAKAEAPEEVAPPEEAESLKKPEEPKAPEEPEALGEPGEPEALGEPGEPEVPEEPKAPESSGEPGEPESSGEPEAPEKPESAEETAPEPEEAEETPASEAAQEALEATHERAPEDAPSAEVESDVPEAEPEAPADAEAIAVPEEDGVHEPEEDKEEKMEKKSMRWFRKRRSTDDL